MVVSKLLNSLTEKSAAILEEAKQLSSKSESWIDFSNSLFDQREGLVARTFHDDADRQEFYESDYYQQLRELLLSKMRSEDAGGGASPAKSGRFVTRIPKTLHSVLEIEAKQEGVSLNQLVLAKLSSSLQKTTDVTTLRVAEAFRQVHDGYSTDRVVVDPDLDARFLARCRDFSLVQTDYFLNHLLYDIRKSKKVWLPRTTKRTQFNDYDLYAFASEIAVRVLQRAQGVSLDHILCDPEVRRQFDEHAQRLAPEQPVLKLRCAALNLRKFHKLKPMDTTSTTYRLESAGPVSEIDLREIPEVSGAYAFYDDRRPLYVAETANLRRRLDSHLEHSGRLGLPSWLGIDSDQALDLRYAPLPSVKQSDRIQWLQAFINTEKPLLNYQQAA